METQQILKQIAELEAEKSTIIGSTDAAEAVATLVDSALIPAELRFTARDRVTKLNEIIEVYDQAIQELMPEGYISEGLYVSHPFKSGADIATYVEDNSDKLRAEWYDGNKLLPKYDRFGKNIAEYEAQEAYEADILEGATGVDVMPAEVRGVVKGALTADDLIDNVTNVCVEKQRDKFRGILGDLDPEIADKTIYSCNVPKEQLRAAYADMQRLSAIQEGAGKAFMEKYLRKQYGTRFTSDDYDRLVEYDDVEDLIEAIRITSGKRKVYDLQTIEFILGRLDDDDLFNRSEVDTVLNVGFGKRNYQKLVNSAIRREEDVVADNREAVLKVLKNNRSEYAKITKSLLGITDSGYADRWALKREDIMRSVRKGNRNMGEYRKHIDELVHLAKISEMQRMAAAKIEEYKDGMFLDKRALKRRIGADLGIGGNLLFSTVYNVSDIETVRRNNRERLNSGLRDMFKKSNELCDFVLNEPMLERRVAERNMREYGDPMYARERLESVVGDVFHTVSVDTEDIISKSDSSVTKGMETVPSLIKRQDATLEDIRAMANARIQEINDTLIDNLTWAKDEDEVKTKESPSKKVIPPRKRKVYTPGYLRPGTYKREIMSPAYEKTRTKLIHEVEDLVEEEGFILRQLPTNMSSRGKFRVSNDAKDSVYFKTLVQVRNWFYDTYRS